jgi:RsiW-degrading membrane proteinase PrsW (M82 family)
MRRIVIGAAIGAGFAFASAIGLTLDALRKLDA